MSDIAALPAQILLFAEGARGRVRRALEEESVEKVRDLLIEINDYLDLMSHEARAAIPNDEDGENAPSSAR